MKAPEQFTAGQLLKAADVARALNVSLPMAYRLMQRGEIAVIRINTAVRVKHSDLEAYIDRCRTGEGNG
ncbi:MAG TPA: helix-turn-helix domain-containing protein [Anaerolineales bacterium]